MNITQPNLKRAWNYKIRDEISKLYTIRTNMTLLLRNNGEFEHIIEPEIQLLINKLQSLILEEDEGKADTTYPYKVTEL